MLGAVVLVAEVGVPLRGMDGELQEKLEATQRRIHICLCGALTGGAATASVIARTAMEAAARAAATATNSSQSPADVDETVNAGVNGTGNVGGPGDSTAATANASSQAPADVDETVNDGLNGTEHIGGPGDSTAGTAARTTGGADEAMLGAAAVEADGGGSAHEHDAGDGHWYDDNEFPGVGCRMEAGSASRGDQGEDIVLPVALRVPANAPWLARRSMARRATRMTCHAPVRTGGAVGAGWDLD